MSEQSDPRVLFAAERTLLAWNRTGLSLIAFGFVIERAGLLMDVLAPGHTKPAQVALAFWLGIAFIVVGAFASLFSARQYSIVLNTISPSDFPAGYGARWGVIINAVVALLGIGLIIVMFFGRS